MLAEFLTISNYRLCNYCVLYLDKKLRPVFIVNPVISKLLMCCTKQPVCDCKNQLMPLNVFYLQYGCLCCKRNRPVRAVSPWGMMKSLLCCLFSNVCSPRSGIRTHWNASEFSPDTRVLSCASSTMSGWSSLDLRTQQSGVCLYFGAFHLPQRAQPCKLLEVSFLKHVLFD